MKKQHIPSPAEVMTQIIQRVERTQIETVYSDIRLLTDDIASCYKFCLPNFMMQAAATSSSTGYIR